MYLARGTLPWEHAASAAEIAAAKRDLSAEQLTSGLPPLLARAIGQLWALVLEGRGLHLADEARPHACYERNASWPAACRETLSSGSKGGDARHGPQLLDWEAAGIVWTQHGEIVRYDDVAGDANHGCE